MAVAKKQLKTQNVDVLNAENVSYVDNHVSSELTPQPVRNSVKKIGERGQNEVGTAKNVKEEDTQLSNPGEYKADQELCSEDVADSVGRDVAAGEWPKETNEVKMEAVVMAKMARSPVQELILENKIGEGSREGGPKSEEVMKQGVGCNKNMTVVDTGSRVKSDGSSLPECKSSVVLPLLVGPGIAGVEKETSADSLSKKVEMALEDASAAVEQNTPPLEESNPGAEVRPSGDEIKQVVGLCITALVNDVVESENDTVSLNAESAKVPSSKVCMSHLSADEAMELLEAHQDDEHDLLPEHDEIADINIEVESKSGGYQWFDGADEDDEESTIEVPSFLDAAHETAYDVFGFGGVVGLTDISQALEENGDIDLDVKKDTLVVPGNSRANSASFRSLASSSPPSACNSASSSEEERRTFGSKKRRVARNNASCKLLEYKKLKCERSSKTDNPSWRRIKRKRKIRKPVIPSEYAIFDVEAADPILKGSYSVHNNRRACFQGNWGFSDEAFHDIESVSPFEYTSHARVLQSRRKDDKRPISGNYRGFFKLRQINGTLVKIREDQVNLQFLPMPSSDEEDAGEDENVEGYESEEGSGYEAAVSRYTVLGKGKNRFGRFLIRGYLSPESGRITVKRRYLE